MMTLDTFARRLLLLVEDDPLIAYQLECDLRKAGARVITAGYLDAASYMAQHPDLWGAVIDLQLGDENAISLCRHLVQRDVPFVVHTGRSAEAVHREWPGVPVVHKPALPGEIATALSSLARQGDSSAQIA
jgi:DNA-binding response OmpR family regulator